LDLEIKVVLLTEISSVQPPHIFYLFEDKFMHSPS